MHFSGHTHPILFVKLDGIGDYLFFRLFLPQIADMCMQKKWRISFFCSKAFLPLVKNYDSSYFSNYFCEEDIIKYPKDKWLLFLRHHYLRWLRGRYGFKMQKINYDFLFNMNTTREQRTERIINAINSSNKQGVCLCSNDFIYSDYVFQDNLYTQLHSIPSQFILNYYKELLEKMFHYSFMLPSLKLPFGTLEVNKVIQRYNLNKKYVVLIPFTSTSTRNYPLEKFLFLVSNLLIKTKYQIIILGQSNRDIQKNIAYHERIIDLTNKTSLIDAMKLAAGATYAIASDTCLRHCALIGGANVITVSNGLTKEMFVEYPSQYAVCQKNFFPFLCNQQGIGDIKSISEQTIWQYILTNWVTQK